jgi:hypothetical protein
MVGKLEPGNKEQISGNIPSSIAPSNYGTNYEYIQMR